MKSQHDSTTRRRRGFSLMEVMAAIVIVAVVATASLSGLSALRGKANSKVDQTNIAELNSKCQTFKLETGKWPTATLKELRKTGYVDSTALRTPFGGVYTFDTAQNLVVNTNAPTP